MNIQDKMQEIHHKFGVTEKANYEIQLFVDDLIKKDRAEQLILFGVSQQRELLLGFKENEYFDLYEQGEVSFKNAIEMYLTQ